MKTRNIREVKVGDIVTDADKKKHWVIDVLKNTFIANDGYGKAEIIMFDIAELEEWQVEGGVDDSEEAREHNRLLELSAKRIEEGTKIMREALNKVTLTEDEIISLLNVTEEQLRDPHFMASRITQEQWKTLKSKLNKMLKDKE